MFDFFEAENSAFEDWNDVHPIDIDNKATDGAMPAGHRQEPSAAAQPGVQLLLHSGGIDHGVAEHACKHVQARSGGAPVHVRAMHDSESDTDTQYLAEQYKKGVRRFVSNGAPDQLWRFVLAHTDCTFIFLAPRAKDHATVPNAYYF